MKQYEVTGMSCAACSARVEKAVSKVPGVTSCSVSLLTNSMGVEGTATDQEIVNAVVAAGYGAAPKGAKKEQAAAEEEEALKDHETPKLRKRLIASVIFLVVLMYFSMGHMMWGWPVPAAMKDNHVAMGLLQMLLTIIIMVINQKFFVSGFTSLLHGAPNMDTLVALGAGASFGYSTYALFAMTGAQVRGDMDAVMGYMHEFYFESAAMILTLITVGKMLESHAKGKTTDALKSLMRLAPKTATVVRDGKEVIVSITEVRQGDTFVVRPGENIPVDGIVLEGSSAVNEAALTGESIPVDKQKGSSVSAATTNQSGFLRCEATRVGEDTTLSQIIKMVSDAAATKAPIAKIADKVSGIFVPAVITIAVITIMVWLLAGKDIGFALARGISVLVISCPCALGLATPVAIMVGNGMGAKNGILFKNAVALENAGKTQIVALDKTGTITTGEPRVTDILPAEGYTKRDLMQLAADLESSSEHPLAKAVMEHAKATGISQTAVHDFQALPGNGLSAVRGEDLLLGGSVSYMKENVTVDSTLLDQAQKLAEEGKSAAYYKAAMSGNDRRADGSLIPGDALFVQKISGITQPLEEMCPYVYETAVSPHLASRLEGNPVQMERVLEDFHKVCEEYEYVTMEGSGGILCPLCIDEADIRLPEVVKACGLGCLLIADAGLGTINGVGLTAYYLKQQGIALKGIIFNHYETGNLLHEDNRKMCEYYTGIPVVACVADGDTELSMDAETLKGLYA